jgi:hypothetical protein
MTQDDHTPERKPADKPRHPLDDRDRGRPQTRAPDDAADAEDDDLSEEELDEVDIGIADPLDESPAEDLTDDPDSTSDTVQSPGSPSEYDRQRDARQPDRGGDNWATDTLGR